MGNTVNKTEIAIYEISRLVEKSIINTNIISILTDVLSTNSYVFLNIENLDNISNKLSNTSNGKYYILDWISKLIPVIKGIQINDTSILVYVNEAIDNYLKGIKEVLKDDTNILYSSVELKRINNEECLKILFFINLFYKKPLKLYKEKNEK